MLRYLGIFNIRLITHCINIFYFLFKNNTAKVTAKKSKSCLGNIYTSFSLIQPNSGSYTDMRKTARGLSKSNPVCLEHWAHNYLFVLSVGNFENFGLRISCLGFTVFFK